MGRALRLTWLMVIVAAACVTFAGIFVLRRSIDDFYVPCRGVLVQVSPADGGKPIDSKDTPLFVEREKNARRIVWIRPDEATTCNELTIPDPAWWSPSTELIVRDRGDGTYDFAEKDHRFAVRLSEMRARRFVPARFELRAQIPALVFLLAMIALLVAAFRAMRATHYATRLHAWSEGTLREDGVVESRSGRTIGRLESPARIPPGDVIVDPADGGGAYRALRMLTRGDVGEGDHERWRNGTLRRLRDARTLAIVATLTTSAAVLARLLS
jgi:hypothetical protein